MGERKRIDEILYEMNREIAAHYGMQDEVLKITVSHKLFDAMVFDMAKIMKYQANYSPSWMNDFTLFGVRIEARAPNDKGGKSGE